MSHDDPHRRLFFAVLERSLQDIFKYLASDKSDHKLFENFEGALLWVKEEYDISGYDDKIMEFDNVCDTLEIDPDLLRGRVLAIVEGKYEVPTKLLGGSLWSTRVPAAVEGGDEDSGNREPQDVFCAVRDYYSLSQDENDIPTIFDFDLERISSPVDD